MWILPLYLHINKKSDDDDELHAYGDKQFANFDHSLDYQIRYDMYFIIRGVFSFLIFP